MTESMSCSSKKVRAYIADYCIAYKPNLAFYESMGVKGWIAFEKTVNYIKENYPDQFIIADAKRGDIGNTSAPIPGTKRK